MRTITVMTIHSSGSNPRLPPLEERIPLQSSPSRLPPIGVSGAQAQQTASAIISVPEGDGGSTEGIKQGMISVPGRHGLEYARQESRGQPGISKPRKLCYLISQTSVTHASHIRQASVNHVSHISQASVKLNHVSHIRQASVNHVTHVSQASVKLNHVSHIRQASVNHVSHIRQASVSHTRRYLISQVSVNHAN